MAASITVHFQILKRPQLPHFLTDLDENGNVRGPKVVIALRSSVFFWPRSLPSTSSKFFLEGVSFERKLSALCIDISRIAKV